MRGKLCALNVNPNHSLGFTYIIVKIYFRKVNKDESTLNVYV
jgi:hypothetical protein